MTEVSRRGLLSGFFTGLIVIKSGVQVGSEFESFENYIAPGKFNIYHNTDEWRLVCDDSKAPLEFDSNSDAERYCNAAGFDLKGDCIWKDEEYGKRCVKADYKFIISAAPTRYSSTEYLRRGDLFNNKFVMDAALKGNLSSEAVELLHKYISADTPAKKVRALANCYKRGQVTKEINGIMHVRNEFKPLIFSIEELYDIKIDGNSYNGTIARLETFKSTSRSGIT